MGEVILLWTLSTDYAHTGNQSMFLGQKVGGDAFASLVLDLDLSGQTDVFLDFWVRATGSGEYRRLYISDDNGVNWTWISNLDNISQDFSHIVIDLADVSERNSLALNDKFRIRFSYFDTNLGDAGDGMVLDDIRLTQRAEAVAGFPLAQESFEGTNFIQGFYPQSFGTGTAELTTDYQKSGTQSVFLGQKVSGDATARLNIALDLSGQTDVFLDFWVRATGRGEYRRLYISDDNGVKWTQIWDLDNVSQNFSHIVIDLAHEADRYNLALNDKFRIRFSYFDTNLGDAGDGMVLDDIRLTQRAEAVASFPLEQQDFEGTTFSQGLYPRSFGNGTAELSTDYPNNGTQSLFLGQKVAGDAAGTLILALDLSGQTDVFLDFWVRATGRGEYRRLYISDDNGVNWTQIRDMDNISQDFSHIVIDLADVADRNNLALNDKFRIRFSYFDTNLGDAGDGMVIDDLRISSNGPPPSSPDNHTIYLPLTIR